MTKEDLRGARKQMWDEIRQLVLNEGPLYDEMSKVLDGQEDKIEEGTRESLVAHMVAHRCAAIAAMDPDGEFFREPASMILGQWAGYSLNQEILTHEIRSLLDRLRSSMN